MFYFQLSHDQQEDRYDMTKQNCDVTCVHENIRLSVKLAENADSFLKFTVQGMEGIGEA